MKSLLLLFILLNNLANGEEQAFDGQAEIALEKALDDMRLGASETKEMVTVPPSIRHPIPPVAPPRASAEQIGINSMNSSIPPMLPPFVVLINPPSPLQMAKSHSNPGPLANFVVRPNEPKRVHKFEFMPHFDKENYEFMIPEGGQMEEDTLVAVLTFFGHLNGEIPKFDIKMDRMNWFSIGDVQTTQESNNYVLSEVPILRRANAKINWTEIDNADGIYKFQVNGIQGPMNASAQIRVEILPSRNYTHLELEPTNEEEKKAELKNITIELGQSTLDNKNGKDENVKEEENKEPGEDLLANEEMDEELLRMDPLGLIDLTDNEGNELIGIEEEQQNMTIRVNLNGEQSRNGQVDVEFTELATYLNNPVANFVVNFEEIHKNTAIDLTKNIVRLELRPANSFLDIRPHYIAPGDQANLWIVDPVKVAELTKGNGGEWQQQFKLFIHQPIIGNLSSTMLIFNGSLVVKGGANPMPAINFTNSAVGGYEFAINEEAKNGHVLGKLEVETTGKIDGRLAFSLYGQGAELFKIDEMGILRLNCHQNISSGPNSTFPDQCLDREMGPSSFYFVASASVNNLEQNLVAPVPITIHVEDANDNPPRPELFNQREIISILNGQIEGGPLVVAIRDEDSSPQNRENHLLLQGNCSKFFTIQKLKNSSVDSDLSYPPLFAINFVSESQQMDESCEHLELIVGDQQGQIDQLQFKIAFKNNQQPIRFINLIYERSLNADKIHIGLPIVRMQLANNSNSHREMNLNYAIIGGNPGWLAIEPFTGNVFVNEMPPKNGIFGRSVFLIKVAAIQNHIKLAESLLKLEIVANSAPSHFDLNIKFPMPFIQMELEPGMP